MQSRGKTHERVWARLFEITEVIDRNVFCFDKTESRKSDHACDAYHVLVFSRASGGCSHPCGTCGQVLEITPEGLSVL